MCSPYQGCPTLYLAHSSGEVRQDGSWYRNFEYSVEQERGLDYREDLFNPLVLTFDLRRDGTRGGDCFDRSAERGIGRTGCARRKSGGAPRSWRRRPPTMRSCDRWCRPPISSSCGAATKSTVIAGYHWFSDWGRDTMIALPGLTLATGRYDAARRHSAGVRRERRSGHAAQSLSRCRRDAGIQHGGRHALVLRSGPRVGGAYTTTTSSFAPGCTQCCGTSSRGMSAARATESAWTSDGLLRAGEPGVQLTWMDAKVGDWVVTPRHGKPVEIQALWYNALRTMEDLAQRFGEDATPRTTRNWRTGREIALARSSGMKRPAASMTWWMASAGMARSGPTRFSPSACFIACCLASRRSAWWLRSSGIF